MDKICLSVQLSMIASRALKKLEKLKLSACKSTVKLHHRRVEVQELAHSLLTTAPNSVTRIKTAGKSALTSKEMRRPRNISNVE